MPQPTVQAAKLYNALVERKIQCKLEAWDDHKHIDISIPSANIDVEIDGNQHYTNPDQIMSDFKRTYHSLDKDDFDTFRVPNYMIDSHLNKVADALAVVARKYQEYIKEEAGLWGWIKSLFIK